MSQGPGQSFLPSGVLEGRTGLPTEVRLGLHRGDVVVYFVGYCLAYELTMLVGGVLFCLETESTKDSLYALRILYNGQVIFPGGNLCLKNV